MREAGLHRQFQGVAAYWRNEQLRILRIRHEVMNGQVREQVEALDSTYTDDASPWNDPNEASRGSGNTLSRMGNWPLNLTLAERYYRFSVGREGRIGNRNAREIVVTPLDDARYGRCVWIDRETRLPLKQQLVAPNGRILEQFVFTELTVADTSPSPDPAAVNGTATPPAPPPVQQAIDTLSWRLDDVPKGYRIIAYTRHNAPNASPVEHLMLSDGFSPISVYIEESPRAFPDDGRLRHFGSLHAFARQAGRYRITVMAEAPPSTVIRIAQGARRGDP